MTQSVVERKSTGDAYFEAKGAWQTYMLCLLVRMAPPEIAVYSRIVEVAQGRMKINVTKSGSGKRDEAFSGRYWSDDVPSDNRTGDASKTVKGTNAQTVPVQTQ